MEYLDQTIEEFINTLVLDSELNWDIGVIIL